MEKMMKRLMEKTMKRLVEYIGPLESKTKLEEVLIDKKAEGWIIERMWDDSKDSGGVWMASMSRRVVE